MTDDSRWTVAWAERPVEEARIFNPAFCGELIGRSINEYFRLRQTALSIAVAFIVIPMTLHRQTRDILPGRANTAFAAWTAEHSALLAELPERVRRLRPITREALIFAIHHQLLAFDDGGLVPGAKPIRPNVQFAVSTDEVGAVRRAAGLLGRWFAAQGSQSSILQGMGLTP